MRFSLASLVLLAAVPAFSQTAVGRWNFDVHQFKPSLTGNFQGVSSGNAFDVDLSNDLDLQKSKTQLGFGLEYQGPRCAVEFSRDEEDYAGSNVVNKAITVNGTTFKDNTLVTSSIKATNNTFNWTIRVFKWPQFWMGLDLGARITELKIAATGTDSFYGVTANSTNTAFPLPVPQIGPALGFSLWDSRVVARGWYHMLAYKGCTYKHTTADLRYFPVSWLGVRVFTDGEHFDIPKGSIRDDLAITMDRTGTGLGLVARF